MEIAKIDTNLPAKAEEKHTPQVGDYYVYNSHGYEHIIKLVEKNEKGFVCMKMQADGSFGLEDEFEREKSIQKIEEWYTYLPDFDSNNKLADKLLSGDLDLNEDNTDTDVRALTSSNKISTLTAMQSECLELEARYKIVQKIAEAKIRRIKDSMDSKIRALDNYCDGIRKQVARIREALSLIDLYTGKSIEVNVLKEGKPADDKEKFTIRQALLYMDEECKIADDRGIDANDIPAFIDWLLSDQKHIDQIVPEKKGVVAIKPRRAPAKEYGDSRYAALVERWNKYTYFLFRNGDNLYSVDSEDFQVYERLIPTQKDLERLQSDMEEAKKWHKNPQEVYERFNLRFYRFLMFLQGVINTTEILRPVPQGINLLDESTYRDWINIIYDDENILGDGMPSYNDWLKKINSSVSVGSRIIYVPRLDSSYNSRVSRKEQWGSEHLLRYYRSDWSMPRLPGIGVYELKAVKLGYKHSYAIMADQENTVALGFLYEDTREREYWEDNKGKRNKVTCLLSKYDTYINYDALSLEDVEYYLNSRIYRTQYLDIMPILLNARKVLREEKRQEDAFRDMLIYHSERQDITADEVDEAIKWWKLKNKYKRPISKDCTKAMRMIKKRLGL